MMYDRMNCVHFSLTEAVDVSPLFRMNSNVQEITGVTAEIQCMKDTPAFYTQITLTAPIFNSSAVPPQDPEEEIANSSNDERKNNK
jgi:hypothetical protein